jgi:hypothetical protein
MAEGPRWVKPSEAAAAIGIGIQAVYRYVRRRRIAHRRIAGRLLVDLDHARRELVQECPAELCNVSSGGNLDGH